MDEMLRSWGWNERVVVERVCNGLEDAREYGGGLEGIYLDWCLL